MSPRHHPSDETLFNHAAGRLSAGLQLVVEAHLESCPLCREQVRIFEAAGGAMLDSQTPAHVSPGLIENIFSRIDADGLAPRRIAAPRRPRVDGVLLPAALAGCEIGPWRFVHPKLRWAHVSVPNAPQDRVLLLKIAAGFATPEHSHRGLELTQVLYGGFSDARGVYEPGDLIEADEQVKNHRPHVLADGDCLSLAALENPLVLNSPLGRLLQPLMGF